MPPFSFIDYHFISCIIIFLFLFDVIIFTMIMFICMSAHHFFIIIGLFKLTAELCFVAVLRHH